MKFLLDQNLSPLLAAGLRDAGHDAVHLRERGLERASDPEVLSLALTERRVLLSADTDFGTLLAASHAPGPSVVLIRRSTDRSASRLLRLVLGNLDAVEAPLAEGAVVVLQADRIRVRLLPIA